MCGARNLTAMKICARFAIIIYLCGACAITYTFIYKYMYKYIYNKI